MTSSAEHQAEKLADGQELQAIEPVGGETDAGGDRRIERIPDRDRAMSTVSRAGRVSPGGGISTMLAGAEHDGAEYAADRLRKAHRRVLRRRAGVGIAAIPGRRAAQPVRGEAMDGEGRERAGHDDEQEHEQAVIGAAARGDRNDREPLRADLHRHARADERGIDRRQRVDEQARAGFRRRGKAPPEASSPRAKSGRSPSRLRRPAARPAEKRHAEGFDEAGRGERRRQREQRADGRHQELQPPWRQFRAEQDRLEGQPFGDESR